MKNKFLKIFYLIIVFIILLGTTQVNATLKTFSEKPSYWNGVDNTRLNYNIPFKKLMYNVNLTGKNAFVNLSLEENFSKWNNEFIYTSCTAECMVFLNQWFKNTSTSELIAGIGNNSDMIKEMDAFLNYFENFISKSASSTPNSFLRTIEDVSKNDLEKYNTDGADGFTQDENSALYMAHIAKNAEEFCKDVRYSIQKMHIAEGKTYTVGGKTVSYNDNVNKKKEYTKEQIQEYIKQYGEVGIESIDDQCKSKWESILGKKVNDYNNEELIKYTEDTTGKKITEIQSDSKKAEKKVETKNEKGYAAYEQGQIYHLPERKDKNDDVNTTNLDQIIDRADKFMNSATKNEIESDAIQNLSNTIYNILLVAGIIIAIIIGAVIGIMFITGSVEQKADVKKLLIPYIVGCVVVFGSFAIWKIAVTMFSSM